MKLLVVRHAIAMEREDYQADSPGASDDFRPLTSEGRRKMKQNAKGLVDLVTAPDFFFSSPLTRAQETAEILLAQKKWSHLKLRITETLRPDETPEAFARVVQKIRGANPGAFVAMVGHEPYLSHFVSWALAGTTNRPLVEIKKGGACLLEFPNKLTAASATLSWLALPSFLKSVRR